MSEPVTLSDGEELASAALTWFRRREASAWAGRDAEESGDEVRPAASAAGVAADNRGILAPAEPVRPDSDLRNRLRIMPVNWHFRNRLVPKSDEVRTSQRLPGEQAAYTIRSITVAIDTQLRSKITRLQTRDGPNSLQVPGSSATAPSPTRDQESGCEPQLRPSVKFRRSETPPAFPRTPIATDQLVISPLTPRKICPEAACSAQFRRDPRAGAGGPKVTDQAQRATNRHDHRAARLRRPHRRRRHAADEVAVQG